MFDFFNQSSRAYANHALAKMYGDRVRRLEAPLLEAVRHGEQPSQEPLAATLEGQRAPLRVLTQPGNQAVAG